MNEMVLAKLIAEEVANILLERGISVRGGDTYDPDRRIVVNETGVGYDDVVRAANEAVSGGVMYNSTRISMLTIIPADANEKYYKAIIEIIKDGNTLPSSKLELVRRITNKFYSK